MLVIDPWIAVKLEGTVLIADIRGAEHGETVTGRAQRHCSFEDIGMTDHPVCHITAIGATGHTQTRRIEPRPFYQGFLYGKHQITVVLSAPIMEDSVVKSLTITRRPLRIDIEYGIT